MAISSKNAILSKSEVVYLFLRDDFEPFHEFYHHEFYHCDANRL